MRGHSPLSESLVVKSLLFIVRFLDLLHCLDASHSVILLHVVMGLLFLFIMTAIQLAKLVRELGMGN